MKHKKQSMFAALLLAVSSCATMSVSSDFDPTAEFSSYRTYAWGPADALPTGDPRLDDNPFFDSRVRSSVERQLAAKGLEKVSPGAADLLIHYHASIQEKVDVFGVDSEYGYEFGYETQVHEYEQGTLLLDIVDVRTKQLIWRAWAQADVEGVIDDPDRMEKRIEKATREMLESFPRSW